MGGKLTIYHGSQKLIQQPVYGAGNVRNDYGLGYYCTENVDLAKEFSDMITTQRGFQANSKIITVSDEILSDLINMKR